MISKRTQEMTPFIVMDVLEKAHEMERRGIHVVHLEVGEPDFDTPPCIKEAACKALADGHTHYTHSLGMPELREAICEHYFTTYNVSIDPNRVVFGASGKRRSGHYFRPSLCLLSQLHQVCPGRSGHRTRI